MMMAAQWEIGRNPFPLLEGDNDYSGRDFDSVHLHDSKSLSHAFLNGVTIVNSAFLDADLDQCEFGEAQLTKTSFVRCLLDGTDFVRATFSDVLFDECDFTDGEWRESVFTRVKFIRCKFAHTTVNLCSFYDCEFLAGSLDGLDYKAVNYNVFSKCQFDGGILSETVLSRNFGLRPAKPSSSVVHFGDTITLEQVCLVSGARPTRVFDLVRAIEAECANFRGRLKKLRLEFISNIVRLMASERTIAPSSLVYIEGVLSALGSTLLEDGDPQAILSAFITVRNALFDRVNEILLAESSSVGATEKIVLEYYATYSREEGVAIAAALDQLISGGTHAVRLVSVRPGSTIFSIDVSGLICSAAAALAAINLLLSQATVSVKKLKALKKELTVRKPRAKSRKSVTALKRPTPALLLSGKQPPELIRLRRAVQESGIILVKLDEPVTGILFIREDGTTATRD
jgi:uncharacterized protein YjbI with pentapeptide repeats